MRVKTYLNTTKEEIEAKKHNIWIGVSLGNKYFTKKNIKKYIKWAVEYTKEDVLVVIVDKIYAINLEVLDGRSKLGALRRAYKKGDEKLKEIQEILEELPEEKTQKIKVVRWGDINRSKYHEYRLEVIFDAFKNNEEFHNYIYSIVKEARLDRNLTDEQIEKLSEYVLQEIPHFINGVKYKAENEDWKTYSLIPYPGLTKLDELFIGLQNRTIFPEITDKLKITDKIAILEAFVD